MAAQPLPNHWEVTRLAGALGAEINGPRLDQVDESDLAAIKQLLYEHMVLFFPGQHLSEEDHITFGRHFGTLAGHPNIDNHFTKNHELFELAASHGGIADEWHSDLTFMDEPSILSILHMVKCPMTGGDTLWANAADAYDALSAPLRDLCDGLTALHDAHPHDHEEQMAIHPVVRIHPETGRKSLFINEHFTRRIVEMSQMESNALLPYLTNWIQSPQFTVRYRWQEGTIGMWDNRCTQHYVLNDFDEERIIQRVTVVGDHPEGDGAPRWQPAITQGRGSAMGRHDRKLGRFLKAGTADLTG